MTDAPAPDRLLPIGVFARRSRLSLKALRHYDRLGLLRPAEVGPDNGYRRYRESQLFTARLIVLLRQLDMPLAQIEQIVAAPGAQGADLLRSYWAEVEDRLAVQRELTALLQASLLGGLERFGSFDVAQRDVPAQLVLTEQRAVRLAELTWIDDAAARLSAAAERNGGPVGERFVIFHGQVTDDDPGLVEVCLPVRAAPPEASARTEPAHREAYVVVTKAQFEMPQVLSAYDAVEAWIAGHDRTWAGSPREVYHAGVDIARAPLDAPVCDIAFPFC